MQHSRFSRLMRGMATLAAATALAVIPAVPSQAITYTYLVGHVMNIGGGWCTGGYTVTGTSGMFTMTAGHCGSPGQTVRGTDAAFATIAHKKPTTQGDSLLTSAHAGVTQLQIIVDPRTGRTPGDGRVVGVMPSSQQTNGTLVGKMGVTTGWTEGKISSRSTWYGRTLICTTAKADRGDSGGPVWRADGNGLRAVGMTVAGTSNGDMCYHPMDELLREWGASLPTFAGLVGPTSAEPLNRTLDDLPEIDPSELVSLVG